ncbi:MAG: hypothetical protein ACYC2H_12930 [Thermoplasmatota archaeon]
MTAARLALLALVLLTLPSAVGKSSLGGDEETERPSSYGSIDGVTYFMLAGPVNASHVASNPGTGDAVMDFQGCAFVQLRPDLDRGRISIAGLIDGFTPMRAEIGDFSGNAGPQGPIATNLTIDAAYHPVLQAGQTVRAEAVTEGIAEMKASEYVDVLQSPPRFVMANFTDPVGGGEELRALLAIAEDGIRDDETGALQDKVTRDDAEMHIVLTSPEGVSPDPDELPPFFGPSDLPDGSYSADAEHSRNFEFLNTRFGGKGTLAFTASSKAPPGFNEVTVLLRAPDGSEQANATVQWSALEAGQATLEFPADQMGFYTVTVTGKLMLGSYSMQVTLDAAPAFQLDFWWEDVVRGAQAVNAYGDCQRDVGLRAQVVAGKVDRAQPPAFPMKVVVLSIAAAAATVLLVVKLVSDQVSSGEFRKQFKK